MNDVMGMGSPMAVPGHARFADAHAARETRQIPSEIAGVHEALAHLESMVTDLETKLSPAMMGLSIKDQSTGAGPVPTPAPLCEIAAHACNAATRVREIHRRVRELIERVEL